MADKKKGKLTQSYLYLCLIVLVLTVQTIYTEVDTCSLSNCVEGRCVNGSCVCDVGWSPPECKHCTGRIRLQNTDGIISDGHGNYSEDNKCTWLVDTGHENTSLWFQFHQFSTECGWDHLYIYDGDSAFSPLLAAFSGLIHKDYTSTTELQEIRTSSGKAYLYFYSDAAYNMSGFNITYRTGGCPKNCSGRGNCSGDVCICYSGYLGENCGEIICPNNCSLNGDCLNNQCQCHAGFTGDDCSLTADKASWRLKYLENDLLARVSSGVAVIGEDIYLVGGYFFNKSQEFLVKYKTSSNDLEVVNPVSLESPPPRYGHSMVAYQNKLYVFGGVEGNVTSRDLWIFNTTSLSWSVQRYNSTVPIPMGVAGHTAHIVKGVMYVLFGYSPIYGYQNRIQEYNIANESWSVPRTRGALVQGGYGHSSVYYPALDKIYIYGGYHARSTSNYDLTDQLYSFEPATRTWIKLRRNQLPRYLHSAVIIDGMMIVFGGNTHNDTSISLGAKCYSPDVLQYDIKCNKWSLLNSSVLASHGARYGHSAVTVQRNGRTEMLVLGGFSGVMEPNALLLSPGNCSYHISKEDCLKSVQGRSCVWAEGRCLSLSDLDPSVVGAEEKQCDPTEGGDKQCGTFTTCPTCLSTSYNCVWCLNNCTTIDQCSNTNQMITSARIHRCPSKHSSVCSLFHNCVACVQSKTCKWNQTVKECQKRSHAIGTHYTFDNFDDPEKTQCPTPCYMNKTCETCTSQKCMWCSNQQKCVETNAYVATFIYGQCMEWTTDKSKCPATRCSDLHSCKDCQSNPMCGWCNDPSNTGIGRCMEGGASGPVNQTDHQLTDLSKCPANQWFFINCPDCQCNGHSTCLNVTGVCDSCQNMTEGKSCERCVDGYYGDASNGGSCSACQCNGQADSCDRKTGACYCRTRGVIGDQCEKCDEPHKYFGNPKTGTCYYNLVTDYQFTFNLSKSEDKSYTQINFMNIPSSSERDVDFKVNCSGVAYLNITMKKKSQGDRETMIVKQHSCNYFRAKFDHGEYSFGPSENTTFLVYVYGFKTPFWLQISFSQFPKIDLVHFFVTFFSCFLSLLIIAAVLYKIKHKYDIYRRRQRMMVEMEEMASRPFSSITVEIDRKYDPIGAEKKETDLRKRKKTNTKPSQIAYEPLNHQKAAVISLIVQLPTGDDEWTPNGASGVAIASALVTVGHHRKQSLEHGGKGDKSKHKKVLFPGNQDMCV
ncbi:attractin-like protein 1 isoform X2 [Saccostrea echinata]|uniref:attractin-like protein 1 isoform X2 n=1 Tax=Saccostrea echinata TaxID=191078 RepID=UPI002A8232E8|nr:attractin-like protein 1 isoform X2 [Saccostrea echinata]